MNKCVLGFLALDDVRLRRRRQQRQGLFHGDSGRCRRPAGRFRHERRRLGRNRRRRAPGDRRRRRSNRRAPGERGCPRQRRGRRRRGRDEDRRGREGDRRSAGRVVRCRRFACSRRASPCAASWRRPPREPWLSSSDVLQEIQVDPTKVTTYKIVATGYPLEASKIVATLDGACAFAQRLRPASRSRSTTMPVLASRPTSS